MDTPIQRVVWPFGDATGRGTGFVFEHFDARGLSWAMRRSIEVWGPGTGGHRERWRRLQRNGMDLPFGWKHRVGRPSGRERAQRYGTAGFGALGSRLSDTR